MLCCEALQWNYVLQILVLVKRSFAAKFRAVGAHFTTKVQLCSEALTKFHAVDTVDF